MVPRPGLDGIRQLGSARGRRYAARIGPETH